MDALTCRGLVNAVLRRAILTRKRLLEDVAEVSLRMAQVVNPECRIVGVSINTFALDDDAALKTLAAIEKRMGLPTVDPFRQGAGRLADALT